MVKDQSSRNPLLREQTEEEELTNEIKRFEHQEENPGSNENRVNTFQEKGNGH